MTPRTTVLVVEDDLATAELERRTLRRAGMEVHLAEGPEEALRLLSTGTYTAVLLDYNLPGGDAWTVLDAAHARAPRVPVIIVTAAGNERLAAEALHRGVDDYVRKAETFWEHLPEAVRRVETRARERVESEARRTFQLLQAVVHASPVAIVALRADGTPAVWNPAAERLFGEPGAELLGPLPAGVSAGASFRDQELEWVSREGVRAYLSVTSVPLGEAEGLELGTLAVFLDLTERRKIEARLRAADRMASLGTLAAGVAHEINNPLAYVIGNLELLELELPGLVALSPPGRALGLADALREARAGSERVRAIVQSLRTFSRGDDERRGAVDIHRVLDGALGMTRNSLRFRARVVRDYGPVELVEGNEGQLAQVFLNLVVNAGQAMPEGAADHHELRISTRQEGPGCVSVEVRDTGCGIPREVLPRVFDPFFTTKAVGEGTGLGLAICHGIVRAHGGEITVESELNRGTVFRVLLPTAQGARPVTSVPPPTEVPGDAPRGRVLVVDDEPSIGRMIELLLGPEHGVDVVGNGTQALDRLLAGERYDVILCDLVMPVMTGMDLYERLAVGAPEALARMVFMTGGAFTDRAREFLDEVPNARVDKPFSPQTLRTLVRSLVARRA
ncbi:MAG: response regulator [Deltaproteobacteria bacterium]|nr:response regulator [Deltaproteobacteria bacterium]